MKPIIISIDVSQSRDRVYDFLDVLANHERFTDHMMRDWQLSGPPRGIGGKAKVSVLVGNRTEPVEIEVIAAEPPVRTVERNIGADGDHVAIGTYALTQIAGGGTRIDFEYAWQQVPPSERIAAPIVRRLLRSALEQAMRRLAEQLEAYDFGVS